MQKYNLIDFVYQFLPFILIINSLSRKSEYSLYSSALSVNHRNAKLFNNMGHVLEAMNRQEDALFYYKEAIR